MLVRIEILCDACQNTVVEGEMEEAGNEKDIDPRVVVRKFRERYRIPLECPECGGSKLSLMIRY